MAGTVAVVVLVAAALGLSPGAGSSGVRAPAGAPRVVAARPGSPFGWLRPAPAPASWHQATTSSRATLFYPADWKQIPGDEGTVTRSLRDTGGLYLGYLNATPRQGTEALHGWAGFRTGHNREEGDQQLRQIAAAEGLRFRDATGSCVVDDYLSRVGGNAYREIACLVSGHRNTDVFIGAALKRDWPALCATLERAASAFVQR
jgi:hypothetical protein